MKVKYSLTIVLLIFFAGNVFGQNLQKLNGYKMVYLPDQASNVRDYVESKLVHIGYKVYTNQASLKKDADFIDDQNLALVCQISHSYIYPHTTISIRIGNADNEVLFEKVADSRGKPFVSFNVPKDQKWVIDQIFLELEYFHYRFDNQLTLSVLNASKFPKVEQTSETEGSLIEYFSNNTLDPIEGVYKSYQSEGLGYYKIAIKRFESEYKAIILDSEHNHWHTGEVKAVFEATSMRGVYSVKWYLGNKSSIETFARIESSSLLIVEFNDTKSGVKQTDMFIKTYPSNEVKSPEITGGIKATGSGFVLTTDGIIATNAHVVEGAKKIEISIETPLGTKTYSATLLLKDESNDIALLKIDDKDFKGFNQLPYSIVQTTEIGEEVFTIGYPLNSLMGNNYKVTNGIVSSNSGIQDDVRFIQITAPLQPGNSGGPLFNKNGDIIGITTSRLDERAVGTSIENVNYAIKASYLAVLYNMLPEQEPLNKKSILMNNELKEQVKVLKNYVCLITVR